MRIFGSLLTGILLLDSPFAIATEIALERTFIKEGTFSILLYKPERSELPLRDGDGVTVTSYSYHSYFPPFDASFVAGFADWTPSKEFEIKKYGSPVMAVEDDLETSVQSLRHLTQKRLGTPVRVRYEKKITYKKYPGREAELEFSSASSKYIIKFRTYIIHHQQYLLHVVYPIQFERYVQPQIFLDSFRLEGEKR